MAEMGHKPADLRGVSSGMQPEMKLTWVTPKAA